MKRTTKAASARLRRRMAVAGLIGIWAFGVGAGSAIAATGTSTFQVTATSQATCSITSNTPLSFGNYSGSAISATTTVMVTCTSTTPFNVGLNAGTASGATVGHRMLTGPGSVTLNYGIYQDTGHTVNWGETIGTDTVAGTGNGSAQPLTLYGYMPSGPAANPGAYTDTITATVTY